MIHPNNAVILPNYQVKKIEIKRQGKKSSASRNQKTLSLHTRILCQKLWQLAVHLLSQKEKQKLHERNYI